MSCTGRSCEFKFYVSSKYMACEDGTSSCFHAKMLVADESEYHDKRLQEATEEIRKIIKGIPADPKGRKLSFLGTSLGMMLAWVDHHEHKSEKANGEYISAKSDPDELKKALGIRDDDSASPQQAA